MSAHDDDLSDDENAQLKQLRAVWVSMRDEDPPDRGLAALMAAARDKASSMADAPAEAARASWWKRVLAVLRRPPVLALASITVLLGGALLVTQHRDSMKSDAPIADERPIGAPVAEPAPEPAKGAGSGAAAAPATIAPTPVPSVDVAPTPPQRPRPRPAPPQVQTERRNTATKTVKDVEPAAGKSGVIETDGLQGAPSPPPEAPAGPSSVTRAPIRKVPPAETQTTETQDLGEAKLKGATKADEDAPDRGPSVSQLVKQCESAATRGDCPAVRLLAKKIKTQDTAAYQQRVANNASIARCLE